MGLLLALPLAGRAAVIYSDSFESASEQDGSLPIGYSEVSSPSVFEGTGSVYTGIVTASGYQYGFSGEDGTNFEVMNLNGPNTNGTGIAESQQETVGIENSNIGTTFAPATTYTLTYLVADPSGIIITSLEADGTDIASQDASGGSGVFAAGPTLTFDTLNNPTLVGQTIGIESVLSDSLEYSAFDAVDDFVLTATPDVSLTPEPSAWALMIAGLLALVGFQVRASAVRPKV